MTTTHEDLDFFEQLEFDIRRILIGEINAVDPGFFVENQNIFLGPVRAINNKVDGNAPVVFVMTTGGEAIVPFKSRSSLFSVRVQIRIRAKKYVDARKTGNRCVMTLDQFPPPAFEDDGVTPIVPVVTPTTSIIDIRAIQSTAFYIGTDSDGFHETSANFDVIVCS